MFKISKHSRRPFLIFAGFALVINACATTFPTTDDGLSAVGAWASGGDTEDCATAPITYFSSDGVVLVLLTAEGPIHSFGKWNVSGKQLTMTHNDFPLDSSGKSNLPVVLEITELNGTRFVTRNAKGDVRKRIKCDDIVLKSGPDHVSH